MFRKERKKCYWGLVLCAALLGIGEFLLNYVSVQESPPFGSTFHIILGTGLDILAVIGGVFIIRHLLHLKKKEKKKKSSGVVFLEHPRSRKNRPSSKP